MDKIAKAIGAVQGGAMAGTATIAAGMAIIPPEAQAPWYAYVIVFAISTLAPALYAYLAPPNKP